MLGHLGRRLIDWVVLAFAAYAFAFVPLGHKTALGHLRAILATDAAHKAGSDLKEAGHRLIEKFTTPEAKANPPQPMRGKPEIPKLAPADLKLGPGDLSLGAAADPPDASL